MYCRNDALFKGLLVIDYLRRTNFPLAKTLNSSALR